MIFFLFQREDLRDRFIRLAGSEDLERTTAALDDAGRRLGRSFPDAIDLWNADFRGCYWSRPGRRRSAPLSAPLWGLLAMILRFVPYIGAILAASLPIALAAAVGSDWSMALWTIALFAVVEPLTGQVVEPFVCGRSAGLSPVAVVVAASFLGWVMGSARALAFYTLDLCLVVWPACRPSSVHRRHVGRPTCAQPAAGGLSAHVDRRSNRSHRASALVPQRRVGRSLLRGDSVGSARPTADAAWADWTTGGSENIYQTVSEIIEDLGSHKVRPEEKGRGRKRHCGRYRYTETGPDGLCTSGLGRLTTVWLWCWQTFGVQVSSLETVASATAIEHDAAETICVCFLEDVTAARGDFTIRKLSRRAPSAKIIARSATR